MGHREFIDSCGIVWTVRSNIATATSVVLAGPWLAFESMTCRRKRLAPVPANWEQLPVDQLETLCNQASDVRHDIEDDDAPSP